MNTTRYRTAFVSRLAISALKQIALLTAVSICMVCGVLADDIAVSEQSFSCINDWPKIRNTHIYNADPEKLNEAIRIFRDSVSDTEYPVGTILQLIICSLKFGNLLIIQRYGSTPMREGWGTVRPLRPS